ncbi:hypothetical protein pW4_3 [Bacillus phage pW4]|uniref:Uncharacterized protein n=1 Tax=Bacillus phage pW4 TaxID=2500560 RepID=A0A3Q9R7K1_9CAUD|nr:hypothetical protein PP656_gp001 [Bacillus phage pW4]AZU99026.1 hypothetical protein pW4_3 [Bacillus phage pW4]
MNPNELKKLNTFIDGYNKLVEETGFRTCDAYEQRPVIEKVGSVVCAFDFTTDENGKYMIPNNDTNYRRDEDGKVIWESYQFNRETGEHDILLGTFKATGNGKPIKIK